MTWEEFVEKYKPHLDPQQGGEMERRYETYGEDLEIVRNTPTDRVWTMIEGDSGAWWLASGFHFVNRLFYVITEHPFEPAEGHEFLEILYAEDDFEEDDEAEPDGGPSHA